MMTTNSLIVPHQLTQYYWAVFNNRWEDRYNEITNTIEDITNAHTIVSSIIATLTIEVEVAEQLNWGIIVVHNGTAYTHVWRTLVGVYTDYSYMEGSGNRWPEYIKVVRAEKNDPWVYHKINSKFWYRKAIDNE